VVRFLHTADLQLGKAFQGVPGDAGARLRQARLDALERLATIAAERAVDFTLVAGDVFDAHTVGADVVAKACDLLARFPSPVYLLPGNHDAACGPGSIWRRRDLAGRLPPGAVLLDDPAPLPVANGMALILPAPLRERRATGDTTAGWTADTGRDVAPGAIRIGLAHGSVADFGGAGGTGADGDAENLVDPRAAERAALDYLALGDWHGCKEVGPRAWYSGSPEPTGFASAEPGLALLVEIDAPHAAPRVEKLQVARTRWLRLGAALHGPADVDALARDLAALDRPADTVLELTVSGALPLSELARAEEAIAAARARLLFVKERGSIRPEASPDDLAAIAADGFVRAAVEALRSQAAGGSGEAARALQILHRISREVASC
jgi:DNA repair exonuclease SbcCD nuclease subunit